MVELVSRYSLLRCVLLLGLLLSGIVRADELPDPTQPLTAASAANSTLTTASQLPVLQSIIYGPQQRKAVLDGHVCHEGTRIGRYRVQAIYADRVVVAADGVRHTLRLFSHKVRYE
ncbi:MAG: hypothetical protein PHD18_12500 [Tolumonas sp.]|nr:hypothetical protein [Tolumonas sp.]